MANGNIRCHISASIASCIPVLLQAIESTENTTRSSLLGLLERRKTCRTANAYNWSKGNVWLERYVKFESPSAAISSGSGIKLMPPVPSIRLTLHSDIQLVIASTNDSHTHVSTGDTTLKTNATLHSQSCYKLSNLTIADTTIQMSFQWSLLGYNLVNVNYP